VATKTPLILIRPLGFFIDSKEIRRSGLDYWEELDLTLIDSLDELRISHPKSRVHFLSTKGRKVYTEEKFEASDLLIFGSEGSGLPKEVFQNHPQEILTIPQWGPVRSLNLATSVGIVLYEAYRQLGFPISV
jgi:tRNA (cytidine/uridine-2'-O-)-methyltransferase